MAKKPLKTFSANEGEQVNSFVRRMKDKLEILNESGVNAIRLIYQNNETVFRVGDSVQDVISRLTSS